MVVPYTSGNSHGNDGTATTNGSNGDMNMSSEEVLQRAISSSLSSYDYTTSLFLAHRLCALDHTKPSLANIAIQDRVNTLLLARVHMASGEPRRVHTLLKGATTPDARFLLARACYDINRYHEGEAALLANDHHSATKDMSKVPNGSAGHYLLGIIALRTGRRSDAADCFKRCLTYDSFHWGAIQGLCELGASHDDDHTIPPVFDPLTTPHAVPLTPSAAPATAAPSILVNGVPVTDNGPNSKTINGSLFTPAAATTGMGSSGIAQPNFGTPLPSSTPMVSSMGIGMGGGTRDMTALSTPPISNNGIITPAPVAPKGRKGAVKGSTTTTTARITRSSSATTAATPATSSSSITATPATRGRGNNVVTRLNYDTTTRRDTRSHRRTTSHDTDDHDDDQSDDDDDTKDDTHDQDDSDDDHDASDARVTRRSTRSAATEKKAKVDPSSTRRTTRSSSSAVSKPKSTPVASSSSSSSTSAGVPPPAPRRTASTAAAAKLTEIAEHDDGNDTKRHVASDTKAEKEHKGTAVARSSSAVSSSSLVTPRVASTAAATATTTQASGTTGDATGESELSTTIGELAPGLRSIAEAYRYQCNFYCKEAIELYSQLPRSQYQTGWVFAQLGRCYVELGDYRRACSMYQLSRRVEPHRSNGMEWYSTALWHLQRKKELSFLGQQMVEFDKFAPQTWIVVGTCFSLQKEHDTALKFFRRAIQLDAYNAYAHTLAAHEHVANEEYEKAIASYRHAFSLDERLYNAWVGIANTYQRQEKLDIAIYHFKRALEVNSRSPVLCTCLALALKLDNKLEEAFALLQRAEELTAGGRQLPTIKFYRALVLIANDQYQDALLELEACRELHPTEAKIHFQLGEVYRRLDMKDRAALAYVTCLDLDPKEKNIVKQALDNLQRSDDDNAPEFQE